MGELLVGQIFDGGFGFELVLEPSGRSDLDCAAYGLGTDPAVVTKNLDLPWSLDQPQAVEMDTLRRYYDAQVQRYANDQAAAAELVKVGVSPVDPQLPLTELAALMNVTTVVMNTPDAYSLR